MKIGFLFLALLGFSVLAHADDNYYLCTNLDASSSAPGATMSMATSDGLAGMFFGPNFTPPRATFDASTTDNSNPQKLTFGDVKWEGGNNGFADFQSAEAEFDASGAMTKITYTFSGVTAEYGNCTLQGDN